jgi:hypothetical protein
VDSETSSQWKKAGRGDTHLTSQPWPAWEKSKNLAPK